MCLRCLHHCPVNAIKFKNKDKGQYRGYYDQRRYFNQELQQEEQREQIVNDALGIVDGLCDGCSQGIISMYDAYIDGLKELDEINREFNAHYEVDDKRGGNRGGCSMM